MKKEIRANNSLTIYYKDKKEYLNMINKPSEFISYVILYLKCIGFQLIHRGNCKSDHSLIRFCCYHRKRNGNLIIWRLQCTRCKKTFSVLPSFVLRYRGMKVNLTKKVLYNFFYEQSLEVCSNLFNVPPMQQYNYICAIGRFGLIGPLTNCSLALPEYIIGDEKHSKCCSQPVYLLSVNTET